MESIYTSSKVISFYLFLTRYEWFYKRPRIADTLGKFIVLETKHKSQRAKTGKYGVSDHSRFILGTENISIDRSECLNIVIML